MSEEKKTDSQRAEKHQETQKKLPLVTHTKEKQPETHDYTVKTLLSWKAPSRPFKKRKKEYFANTVLILFAIEIILFLFGQTMLMLVALSLAFLTYALAVVPPHDYFYKISTEGLSIEDHFFLWQELYDFYFKEHDGMQTLHIRTKAYFPGELVITLGEMTDEHLKAVLLPYLPYREIVEQSFMEKSGDWLSDTFPLEKQ